jgi:hypothetical protein
VGTKGISDFFKVFRMSELLTSDISKCGETWLGLRQRENTGQTIVLQDAFVLVTKPVPGRLGCRRITFSLRRRGGLRCEKRLCFKIFNPVV